VLAGRLSLAGFANSFACIDSSVFLKKSVNFGIRRLTKCKIALNEPFNKWRNYSSENQSKILGLLPTLSFGFGI
jgi:hypothetical protein